MKLKQLLIIFLVFSFLMCLPACGRSSNSLTCTACGKEYTYGMLYCPSCGEKLATSTVCGCGHENEAGAKFCSSCGASLQNNNANSGANNGNNDVPQADNAQNIWLKITSGATSEYAEQYYYNYDGVLVAMRRYYTATDSTTGIYEYSYDEHGNMVLETKTYDSYSGKTFSRTYTNQYDENGKLISVTKGSDTTEYKYDANGILTEKITRNQDGVETSREEYENGKIKRSYGLNGYEYEDQYFYDKNGRLEKKIGYTWEYIEPGPGESEAQKTRFTDTTTFTYDSNGNIVAEITTSESGDTSTNTYRYMSLADYRAQGLHTVLPTPTGDASNSTGGSSDNGSGGSSGSGVKCTQCKQTGKIECSGCDGTGKVFHKYDDKGNKVMKNCMVPSCTNGKIKCPYCGGDGIVRN